MRSVKFNNIDSSSWQAMLTAQNIGFPEVKTSWLEIEGKDGKTDLSEILTGCPTFKNRQLEFKFTLTEGSHTDRTVLLNNIASAIHGKTVKVVVPDDDEHYFEGKATVTVDTRHIAYHKFTVKVDAQPFRVALTPTEVSLTLPAGGAQEINLINNGDAPVVPIFTVTGGVNFTFGNFNFSGNDETFEVNYVVLQPGANAISVYSESGGTVKITYNEGVL